MFWRRVSARWMAAACVAAALALLTGGAGWAYVAASAVECEALPREDLSLSEMVQLRRRLDAYRDHPESPLALSGREASFLMREQFDLPAWLAIRGGEVALEARIGETGRCWNVGFRGELEVRGGRPLVSPDELRVGKLQLGWWLRGRQFELPGLEPSEEGAPLATLLAHLVQMDVVDGEVYLRLDDPAALDAAGGGR
ncbi:MAG: hypothetical protein ABMA64_29230 [Myxococcota bacterium]